jgi:hypothetical protein
VVMDLFGMGEIISILGDGFENLCL